MGYSYDDRVCGRGMGSGAAHGDAPRAAEPANDGDCDSLVRPQPGGLLVRLGDDVRVQRSARSICCDAFLSIHASQCTTPAATIQNSCRGALEGGVEPFLMASVPVSAIIARTVRYEHLPPGLESTPIPPSRRLVVDRIPKPKMVSRRLVAKLICGFSLIWICCGTTMCGRRQERGTTCTVWRRLASFAWPVVWSPT